jgi:hypothetical protein
MDNFPLEYFSYAGRSVQKCADQREGELNLRIPKDGERGCVQVRAGWPPDRCPQSGGIGSIRVLAGRRVALSGNRLRFEPIGDASNFGLIPLNPFSD